MWIPERKKVIRSRDVLVNEAIVYDPGNQGISDSLPEATPEDSDTIVIDLTRDSQENIEGMESDSDEEDAD